MNRLTVAICTYNRANFLPKLVAALRGQECFIPFEILVIDNNSTDNTQEILREFSETSGTPVRVVKERHQGITYARNRAIEESRDSKYLVFIDDDELPLPGWLKAAVDALENEGADCVGGGIRVHLALPERPGWLNDELLGFLGQVQYGSNPFWITDRSTPIWSGNIAYRTSLFAKGLCFDHRYNRPGQGVGGGEDAIMLRRLLDENRRIRYRPDMVVEHFIGPEKLRRGYFLRRHFIAGCKFGQHETGEYEHTFLGIPPFMIVQVLRQYGRACKMYLQKDPKAFRQLMNAFHAIGCTWGRVLRYSNIKLFP
jgi:glycosyltransferase involved in cell wall biosynthesis